MTVPLSLAWKLTASAAVRQPGCFRPVVHGGLLLLLSVHHVHGTLPCARALQV